MGISGGGMPAKLDPQIEISFFNWEYNASGNYPTMNGEWIDSDSFLMWHYEGANRFKKFDTSDLSVSNASTTIYAKDDGARMLRDRKGNGNIWLINSANNNLYLYNGTSFVSKVADSANGRLAYDDEGTIYFKSSTSTYYSCYNI